MSEALARRPEKLRLARTLAADPAELEFLDDLSPAELRALLGAISDRLLDRNRRQFERAVALSRRLPDALSARLAQHALGPVLAARTTALLTPEEADGVARRLPPDFLADVAENVDLRHVGPLVGELPPDTLRRIGAELCAREQWLELGAAVGHLRDEVLAQVLDVLDGEALLRAAFVVEQPERLDAVVGLLADHRLDELLRAAHENALWPEAIGISVHLGRRQQKRIAAAIGRLGAEALDELLALLAREPELSDAVARWQDLLERQLEPPGAAGGSAERAAPGRSRTSAPGGRSRARSAPG